MKVIAQVDDSRVLCEVSITEIAKLHGLTGKYDKGWNSNLIKVNAEHDLVSAFEALDTLRRFDEQHLKYLAKNIDSMQKSYNTVLDTFNKLALFDKLSTMGTNEEV
jgi:hypothetical protein